MNVSTEEIDRMIEELHTRVSILRKLGMKLMLEKTSRPQSFHTNVVWEPCNRFVIGNDKHDFAIASHIIKGDMRIVADINEIDIEKLQSYFPQEEVFGEKKLTLNEIYRLDFVWNVDSYENAGRTFNVTKGSPVVRNYSRNFIVKLYDSAGDPIPYSDIGISQLYDQGDIIENV